MCVGLFTCGQDSVCVDVWMSMCVCMCVDVSAYLCQSKQFGLLSHTFTKEANFDRPDQTEATTFFKQSTLSELQGIVI